MSGASDTMSGFDPAMEELHMPSRWVKRVSADESIRLHVERTINESKRARSDPHAKLGVSIGPGASDVIDIFNEDGGSGKIIVYVAGGYWLDLNGEMSAYTVLPLVADGHTVMVVHYDRAPTQMLPQIIEQVERSLFWIMEYAIKSQKKVWLSGHSAGSHLCAMALSSTQFRTSPFRPVVLGVIHLSGVFDLAPIRSTSINTVLKLTEGEAGLYSPLSDANIDRLSLCPEIEHHLVVGEYDSPPFHKQAHAFRDALAARGITTSLQVLPGLDHFDLVENLASEQSIPTIAFKKIIQELGIIAEMSSIL